MYVKYILVCYSQNVNHSPWRGGNLNHQNFPLRFGFVYFEFAAWWLYYYMCSRLSQIIICALGCPKLQTFEKRYSRKWYFVIFYIKEKLYLKWFFTNISFCNFVILLKKGKTKYQMQLRKNYKHKMYCHSFDNSHCNVTYSLNI